MGDIVSLVVLDVLASETRNLWALGGNVSPCEARVYHQAFLWKLVKEVTVLWISKQRGIQRQQKQEKMDFWVSRRCGEAYLSLWTMELGVWTSSAESLVHYLWLFLFTICFRYWNKIDSTKLLWNIIFRSDSSAPPPRFLKEYFGLLTLLLPYKIFSGLLHKSWCFAQK